MVALDTRIGGPQRFLENTLRVGNKVDAVQPRKIRVEYAGAIYDVISPGDRREICASACAQLAGTFENPQLLATS